MKEATGGGGPADGGADGAGPFSLARPPRNNAEVRRKLLWICIWFVFLGDPMHDLASGGHAALGDAWGWSALGCFVAVYLVLVFRHTSQALERRLVVRTLAVLFVLATALSLTLGESWLTLYVYVAVACGATLPLRSARVAIIAVTAVMMAVNAWFDGGFDGGLDYSRFVPPLLGGFAMTGVRQMVMTTRELRRARATVAQLAANEERLRLARDLHDLLGHSLSLITLKSELAGRMLPGEPVRAAQQVEDIERVSRQALVDVREAVTGYRRPRLLGELAGAQVALTAAGITPVAPGGTGGTDGTDGSELPDGLSERCESALAWALREAVTNVVRHSGARTCTITLSASQTLDGPYLQLSVEDDGAGGSGTPGNGLTGLTERLDAVGGTLEATAVRGRRGGFRLVARAPLGAAPAASAGAHRVTSGPVGSGS